MGSRRLSLVASFDDLCRNTDVLTKGVETDFIKFVSNQDKCRMKWLEAESKLEELEIRSSRQKAENDVLRTKLKHVRNDLAQEMKLRSSCELEKSSLERQIQLVRELLLNDHNGRSMLTEDKLAFLNDSKYKNRDQQERLSVIDETDDCSASDISYDKSEECLEVSFLRSGRRWKLGDDNGRGKRRRMPSAPPVELDSPPKRRRSLNGDLNTSVTTTTTVRVPVDPHQPITAKAEIRAEDGSSKKISSKYHRRSKSTGSELILNDNNHNNYNVRVQSTDDIHQDSNNVSTPKNGVPSLVRTNSSCSRLNKNHIFVTKTAIRPEHCCVCNKRLNFGGKVLKCRDCRVVSHPDKSCKDRVPLPCIPVTPNTPGIKGNTIGVIGDFAPLEAPMIPALVIMCAREVEMRGLREAGIYRISGSDREAKELKEKFFRRKGSPNLSAYHDIHVICCCLKSFLRGLKEPLVTYELWGDFINATECNDHDEGLCQIYQAVSMLPQANRDTLAYLILHLKKVARSEECKMPQSNLSKVLGPTMIGYSCHEPTPMQMITETKKQANVMEMLMSIEDSYWSGFINDAENTFRVTSHSKLPGTISGSPQTPEVRQGPRSILGPVNTTGKVREVLGMTPRFKKGPRHFFSSPSLN